ncbi:hypothetical protein A3D55_01665 [Candidatus Jorgensenbacteria bacterium RIFCSPHIGHO2_02_FULL_45_20]|nr:MAG: hypothetical protein A3D55_01665 [Candidatus Jorgensenbacteria bacterium RIFCSPHIGHO2_02_FULL_45_20]
MSILQRRKMRGQMTLPFILLVSGIIVEISIAGSFVAYFLSTSGYGERLSVRANAAANSGVRDAMVRIAQNKEFVSNLCSDPYSYPVLVGDDASSVSVCRITDEASNKYVFSIEGIGYAGSRQKKIFAQALVDSITGHIQIESISEQKIE